MACGRCKKVKRSIPTQCKPPLGFQEHDWIMGHPPHDCEFCKKCKISRRTKNLIDVNDPCPGRPPRLEIAD